MHSSVLGLLKWHLIPDVLRQCARVLAVMHICQEDTVHIAAVWLLDPSVPKRTLPERELAGGV